MVQRVENIYGDNDVDDDDNNDDNNDDNCYFDFLVSELGSTQHFFGALLFLERNADNLGLENGHLKKERSEWPKK